MKKTRPAALHRRARQFVRGALATLPVRARHALFRRLVDCSAELDAGLELKIAQTQEELEACFALLHDAYVASGFMRPHPSGLRVTPHHALPTTTTLCAKIGGRVVGTLSIVREGVFGFPMQSAFDLSSVRAREGRIAEISALAVHPDYRQTGGAILFPLMKFMYGYCTQYFDTRHLVIAVHPNKIELYESLLFFRRLAGHEVTNYDFANGAPAVGATLDLHEAPALFRHAYAHRPQRRNLHRYFVDLELPQIRYPVRPWHTSNDPVLTPALLDHFFNRRTSAFEGFDERKKRLLHTIYGGPAWAGILPMPERSDEAAAGPRRNPRFSLQCPAAVTADGTGPEEQFVTIVEMSSHGFQARAQGPLQVGSRCAVVAELGLGVHAQVHAHIVRRVSSDSGLLFGFRVERPDPAWRRCMAWLEGA